MNWATPVSPSKPKPAFAGNGCLEKIFSSEFLGRVDNAKGADLHDRISHFDPADAGLERIAGYLSMASPTSSTSFVPTESCWPEKSSAGCPSVTP